MIQTDAILDIIEAEREIARLKRIINDARRFALDEYEKHQEQTIIRARAGVDSLGAYSAASGSAHSIARRLRY